MKLAKIVAIAALMVAGAAQAQNTGYTTFEFSQETKRADDTDKLKGGLVVGIKTPQGQDYSIKLESSQTRVGEGSISTGLEVRAKQNFAAIGYLTPYLGVRLGEKMESDKHFSHYAVDAGVKFPIVGALSGDVGVRYRNAFNTANAFDSTRYHVIAAYALTKTDSVAVRYSQAYGAVAEEKDAWRLSYTHSF